MPCWFDVLYPLINNEMINKCLICGLGGTFLFTNEMSHDFLESILAIDRFLGTLQAIL